MSKPARKSLVYKTFRVVRIYAFYLVIATIFANPIMEGLAVRDASAQGGPCGGVNIGEPCPEGGTCQWVDPDNPGGASVCIPEIPALFIPLFIVLSIASVYYIRRRQMAAYQHVR